jgi:glutathione peroxidase-family protein
MTTSLQAGVFDGIKATDIDGKEVDLGKYSGIPAVLVVNLASA